jgi:hypothetical protein
LQDFIEEDGDQIAGKVKFDHYEKRRKLKMKFIHEFMQSLKKKSRGPTAGGGLISLNLLPKESVVEFKKSKCNFNYLSVNIASL